MKLSDKARHVRAAPNNGDHHCHWPGCTKKVPPALWGCRYHWYKLPRRLQALIWRHYRPGQEITKDPSPEYIDAAEQVQRWIRENALPSTGDKR